MMIKSQVNDDEKQVDGARKRSLARQMQRLLTEIVALPEYRSLSHIIIIELIVLESAKLEVKLKAP